MTTFRFVSFSARFCRPGPLGLATMVIAIVFGPGSIHSAWGQTLRYRIITIDLPSGVPEPTLLDSRMAINNRGEAVTTYQDGGDEYPIVWLTAAHYESFSQTLTESGLSTGEWSAFVEKMANGSQSDKENYNCWMQRYLTGCVRCPSCPGNDPFAN